MMQRLRACDQFGLVVDYTQAVDNMPDVIGDVARRIRIVDPKRFKLSYCRLSLLQSLGKFRFGNQLRSARHGIVYSGGQAWTGAHDAWLRRQRFTSPAVAMAFESDYDAVLAVKARRDRLDAAITTMAADSEFTPIVRRLGCLRGVSTLTGFALAVEIGDWHRFTGNTIGAFVGLVPCEYSSGASRTQGSITKTGNTHVRRLLVEGAWHHRARYVTGKTLRDRWELAPPAARARGDAGNRRLHNRWISFNLRHKRSVIANVAIARELAGWCWSLAILE
jgi:transposase